MGHVSPVLDQTDFRFRNDDGSETAATWIETTNTNATISVDTNFRIRIAIAETNGGSANNIDPQLQYNLNSAGWNDVNATSSVVQSVASPNITDDVATTQQLTSGTFVASSIDEVDGLAARFSFAGNDKSEAEFVVQILSGDVANNDSIQLRCVNGTTVLDNYTNTPTATVSEQANEIITATTVSLSVSPQNADVNSTVDAVTTSLTLTPQNAQPNEAITATTASLSLTAQNADVDQTVDALTVSLTLTPQNAEVSIGQTVEATTASLTLTPQNADVNSTVDAVTASLSLTPQNADVNETIQALTASLALTPQNAQPNEAIIATTASLTLTPQDATTGTDETITATTATLTLTAQTANVNQTVDATTASLTLTSQNANVNVTVDATTSTLTLTPQDATVSTGSADETITATTATLTLSAQNADINDTVTPTTASLSLTAQNADVNEAITPNTGTLTLTPQNTTVIENTPITATTASLSLTGQEAFAGNIQTLSTTHEAVIFSNVLIPSNTNVSTTDNITFTINEAGHYLYFYTIAYEDTGGTDDSNAISWTSWNAATHSNANASAHLIRTDGIDKCLLSGASMIDFSAGDEIRIRHMKWDSGSSTENTIPQFTSIQFVKINDDLSFYDAEQNGLSNNSILWDELEIDNDVYVDDGNGFIKFLETAQYLVLLNATLDSNSSGLHNWLTSIELGSVGHDAHFADTIMSDIGLRGTTSLASIFEISADERFRFFWSSRTAGSSATTIDASTHLTIIKLPTRADYFRLSYNDNNQTIDGDVDDPVQWDEREHLDAGSFAHNVASNNTKIQIDQTAQYLFMPFYSTLNQSGVSSYCQWKLRKNGTDTYNFGTIGQYERGAVGEFPTTSTAVLIDDLTDTDYIEVTNTAFHTSTTNASLEANFIFLQGLNLTQVNDTVIADRAALTLTGQPVLIDSFEVPNTASLNLSGKDAVINAAENIQAATASMSLSANNATLEEALTVSTASLTFTGINAEPLQFVAKNNFYAKAMGSNGFFINVGGNNVLDWKQNGIDASGRTPAFFFIEDDNNNFEDNAGDVWSGAGTIINGPITGDKVS